jgi:DNA repair photolyase
MNNNNPLWFNISTHINSLEDQKQKLIEKRNNIVEQIAELNNTIALLELGGVTPRGKPRTVSVSSQTDIHLPKSRQLMTSPLTALQKEEEEREKRIFSSLKKK